MHRIQLFSICLCFIIAICVLAVRSSWAAPTSQPANGASANAPTLRVMVYDDSGAPDRSYNFIEHVLTMKNPQIKDPENYVIKRVKGADIRGGVLDGADIVVFPGGSGSVQAKSLEEAGRKKVVEFVKNGGGYLGICGGSYLATSYYPWSLSIVNASVVDRAHWNRGRATLPLNITSVGKQTLGIPTDTVMCLYHQGPLLAPDHKPGLPQFETLATFGGEVTENGAPKGVMIGTDAIVRTVFEKGRVILISPHPEQTAGLEYFVPAALKWISKSETGVVAGATAKSHSLSPAANDPSDAE